MNNFKQYIITTIGMMILTIYYLISFFEFNIDYFFHVTIFILSICLFLKLVYWYGITQNNEKGNLLRFSFLILTYLLPIYMIIQESTLIIDIAILKLSYLIVFIFAFIGTLIERYLFLIKKNNKESI
tara:strand:- start:680 stop:1060 length:381 start_codon:yes stop_codon:yes gene_type:complete